MFIFQFQSWNNGDGECGFWGSGHWALNLQLIIGFNDNSYIQQQLGNLFKALIYYTYISTRRNYKNTQNSFLKISKLLRVGITRKLINHLAVVDLRLFPDFQNVLQRVGATGWVSAAYWNGARTNENTRN